MSDFMVAEAINKLARAHERVANSLEALVTLAEEKDAREARESR